MYFYINFQIKCLNQFYYNYFLYITFLLHLLLLQFTKNTEIDFMFMLQICRNILRILLFDNNGIRKNNRQYAFDYFAFVTKKIEHPNFFLNPLSSGG